MKAHIHAMASARKYGGVMEDYMAIHEFMDSSKQAVADVRHRVVFHSAFGIFIVEKVFGTLIKNSDGRAVSVRDIAEDHVLEDLGTIPSLGDWLDAMEIQPWMGGPKVKRNVFKFGEKTGTADPTESLNNLREFEPHRYAETITID